MAKRKDPLAALGALADTKKPTKAKASDKKTVKLDPSTIVVGKKKVKNAETGKVEEQELLLSEVVESWGNANAQMKEAKAVKEQTEAVILEHAEPAWKEGCQKDGTVRSSIHVGTLTVAFKKGSQMFSRGSVDPDAVEEALGDQFDELFTVEEGPFQLSEEATNDVDFIADLVKLVQKHDGAGYLTRSKTAKPKDTLYDMRVLKPEEYAPIEKKLKEAGVRNQKPTFSAR